MDEDQEFFKPDQEEIDGWWDDVFDDMPEDVRESYAALTDDEKVSARQYAFERTRYISVQTAIAEQQAEEAQAIYDKILKAVKGIRASEDVYLLGIASAIARMLEVVASKPNDELMRKMDEKDLSDFQKGVVENVNEERQMMYLIGRLNQLIIDQWHVNQPPGIEVQGTSKDPLMGDDDEDIDFTGEEWI